MKAPDTSTPCRFCGTRAIYCGRVFRLVGEWCCPSCRFNGAAIAHREEEQ